MDPRPEPAVQGHGDMDPEVSMNLPTGPSGPQVQPTRVLASDLETSSSPDAMQSVASDPLSIGNPSPLDQASSSVDLAPLQSTAISQGLQLPPRMGSPMLSAFIAPGEGFQDSTVSDQPKRYNGVRSLDMSRNPTGSIIGCQPKRYNTAT